MINEKKSNTSFKLFTYLTLIITAGVLLFLFLDTFFTDDKIALVYCSVILFGLAIFFLLTIPLQILRFFARTIRVMLIKTKKIGLENIPKKGGALLVSNHVSFIDFLILSSSIQRNLRFVMHEGLYNKKLVKPILKKLHMIPIAPRGGQNDLKRFNEACQKEINNGHLVVIFAEGTVTRNGHTLPFKRGIEHIAKGITAPIIPINMEGVLGTPLSFSTAVDGIVKPTIKTIGQTVYLTIGEPIPPTTSAYVVRQKVLSLGARTFAERIDKKSNLGTWVLNMKGNNKLIQDIDNEWLCAKEIKNKSLSIANRLSTWVSSDKKIALIHPVNSNFHLITYALAILGKEIIILSSEKTTDENKEILAGLGIETCINGYNKDINPCKGYIDSNRLFSPQKEGVRIKLLRILPTFLVLKMLHNNSGKFGNMITFVRLNNQEIKGVTLTNAMIFAQSLALQQIHLTNDYGTVLNLHKVDNTLGFFIKILLPVTLNIPVTLNNIKEADTVVGLMNDVETLIENTKESDLSKVKNILTDSQTMNPSLQETLKKLNITYYQGFGIKYVSPIISVNTPNFIGNDIAGKQLIQEGNNPNSVGRPIPSIAIKIVDPNALDTELGINQRGRIMIRGASITKRFVVDKYHNIKTNYLEWIDTEIIGMIDEEGYLKLE